MIVIASIALLIMSSAGRQALSPVSAPRPEETEVWSPVTPVVAPGPYAAATIPSDAILLFNGKDLRE